MKNKILMLNTVAGKGSVGRLITGLSSALKEIGHEPYIAFGRWDAPIGFASYRIEKQADIICHGVMSRLTDRHGLYSSKATRKLIEIIRGAEPDIIHLHNIHGYYVNYEILFSFLKSEFTRKGGRVVWTLHDCWSFTGHCVHFEYAGCDRWKTQCFRCPEKNQYPASLLLDSSRSNYERKRKAFTGVPGLTLVTPSEWLKDRVKESYLKDYPVEVVPTGIDTEQFKPLETHIRERYGIGDKTLLLGVASPWRERKGFYDFLKLSGEVHGNTVIALVGLNRKQMEEARPHGNIIPVMKTDSVKELAEWYSAADYYVNLTLEDTFPTTNIEAMACGTPVITYRSGGSGESLTENTGRIVDKGDTGAVLRAVSELSGIDREEIRRCCLERASEYAMEKRFSQYIEGVYGL